MQNFIAIAAALILLPTTAIAQSQAVQVDWSVIGRNPSAQQALAPAYTAPHAPMLASTSPVQAAIGVPALAPEPKAPIATPKAPDPTGLWGAKWSGRANAGAAFQSGNSDKENLDLDAKIKAKWEKHRVTAKAEYTREEDENVKTEDNRSLELLGDYFFKPKWFANANLKWETDDIAALDSRSSYGVALGHQPFDTDDLSLKYQLGPNWLQEERTNGTSDDSLAYNWQLDYEQKFWDGNIEFFHNHQLLIPSDETSSYLLDTNTGARIPLRKSIIATFEIEHDVDKGAPQGTSESDTTYALKLGYEW